MAAAADAMERGDESTMREAIERRWRGGSTSCDVITLAHASLRAWSEARAVAGKGGAVDLLGPVKARLDELRAITNPALAIDVEYAQMAVGAAVAAAQDERPEMELLLQQARDLSERLARRERRAVWPRPFNLMAGELWFEVDRFEEARAAYERAASYDGSAAAFAGLGRVLAALGRHDQACAAYRRVAQAGAALADEAKRFLARCP